MVREILDKVAHVFGYERRWHDVFDYEMERYPEDSDLTQPANHVTISKIEVPTERDKIELLKAIEYLHNNRLIDTDYYAVNTLVHIYERPELIEVKNA